MAPTDSELPTWLQIAFNVGTFLAVAVAGSVAYLRRSSIGNPHGEDVRVIGGAFADRLAMQDLTEALSEAARKLDALPDMASEMRRSNEELERIGRFLKEK